MDSEAVFITKKLLFAVLIIFSMAIFCSNTLYATNETQIANGTNITFNETTIEYNNSIDSTTLAENTGNYTNSTVNRTENNDENSTNAENATAAAGENNYTNIHGIWIPSDIALSLTSANVTQLMNAGITDVYIKCNINPNSNNPYNTVLNYVVALFKNSGIRINAWITCFQDSNGNWIDPSNTTRKNEILTAITDIVKKYGVSGVNLDYVRYPGTAYKYTNGTQTITSFVASVYSTVKSINPNIAISADLMPEGSVNAYYYGQDYSALSQYLDYLIPMIYKGNYNKDTAWIGTTTQYIVNHSNGKPVIAGILTYISDSNVTKLSPEVLAADVNQAMNNGASGYALFRYGLTSSYPVTYTPVTFTLDQILNAATSVKTYIETNKKLPDTVTIDGRTISISQFLYLATQATIKINSGNYSSITTGSFSTPSSGYDNLVAGQITLANYVDFAQRIVQHMNWNGVAPNYGRVTIGSNTGEVSYQAQIYLYSRILAYYKTNGTLPTSLTVKSWSTANIPITEPSKFTITQITTAAAWLKTYIETNKTLPSTITVGTTTMDLADFLYLATQATVQINSNNNNPITLNDQKLPSNGYDNLVAGQITLANYVDFAQRIVQHMNWNGVAPNYGRVTIGSNIGEVSYQAQIYLYSRILAYYKTNGTLPTSLTVKSWSTTNIPIIEPASFTINQITTAAAWLKTYIETNKTLPSTITVGTTTMDLADFLYLATQATVQINSNNNNPITLNDQKLPSPSSEQLTTELLTLASYVDFAQRIVQHMNWNGVAPEYGIATIGKVSYESQIYIYSRILAYYQTNKVLPTNIVVKSWNATNIPTNGINVSFTIDDIANASTNVKNYIENNKRLPNTVKVGDVVMGVAQYLYLATKATIELNNNITSPITVGDFLLPSSSYNEVSSGTITLSNYVDFAQRIAQHMDWNGVAPNYGHVTIDSATGYINYQSMIYIYSRILDFYITNDRLPNSVSTIPWSIVTYSLPAGYEQYLAVTNNCQVDDASIQALSNSITSSKTTLYDKAAAIFNWVRDNIGYSFYYNTKYGAVGTLNARTGNCVDTSHLIIALARAACIPARYEHVYAQFSSGSWYGHVIAQVYVNGQWYNADGTSSRNTFGVISNWNTGTATYYGTYASLPF